MRLRGLLYPGRVAAALTPRAAVIVISLGVLQAWTNSNNNFRLSEAEVLLHTARPCGVLVSGDIDRPNSTNFFPQWMLSWRNGRNMPGQRTAAERSINILTTNQTSTHTTSVYYLCQQRSLEVRQFARIRTHPDGKWKDSYGSQCYRCNICGLQSNHCKFRVTCPRASKICSVPRRF